MTNKEALPFMDRLKAGMMESYEQTITDADIKTFAGLSGDNNASHSARSRLNEGGQ